MQIRTWLLALIVLVFTTTLFVAVTKVRSPVLKFDRIEVGMSSDDVEQLMAKRPKLRVVRSAQGCLLDHTYQVGLYEIDVYISGDKVVSKSIEFRPPWVPAEWYEVLSY